MQSFFTCGPDEVRQWSIRKGFLAPEAAGVIHGDFQKCFISADVYKFKDWNKAGANKEAELALVENLPTIFPSGNSELQSKSHHFFAKLLPQPKLCRLSRESELVEETHAQSPSETLALWPVPKPEEGSNTLTRAGQRFSHAPGRLS